MFEIRNRDYMMARAIGVILLLPMILGAISAFGPGNELVVSAFVNSDFVLVRLFQASSFNAVIVGFLTATLIACFVDLLVVVSATVPGVASIINAVAGMLQGLPRIIVAVIVFGSVSLSSAKSGISLSRSASLLLFSGIAAAVLFSYEWNSVHGRVERHLTSEAGTALRLSGLGQSRIARLFIVGENWRDHSPGRLLRIFAQAILLEVETQFILEIGFGSLGRSTHESYGAILARWRWELISPVFAADRWVIAILCVLPIAGLTILSTSIFDRLRYG